MILQATETQSVADDSAEAGAGLLVGDWEANLLQSELAGSLSLFGQQRSPPDVEDTMSILASTTHLDLEAGHLRPGALQGLTLITVRPEDGRVMRLTPGTSPFHPAVALTTHHHR